ncbi:MAG: transposase [Deltaproteobacteria bacterium]|nr:transposase [Deltaproteobacteria bacterium]
MSKIVSDIVSCENQIHQFFLNQKIGSLLKRSNIDKEKEKGISPVAVFRVLVTLVFTGKNMYCTLEAGGSCGMAKDTVYRFLNSVHTNWRRFLLLLSSRVISQELEPLTGAANMKVMIADDTLYRRNRGKHVELLSRVFDHTDNRYYRGFRMLTLGWSDGISFLPVSFAMLASSKEQNRLVPLQTDLDRRTNRAKRRREGIRKATDVLVEMVAEAVASGIPRTLGTLFHACCEELQQATFAEALALVLMLLTQELRAATEMTRELLRSLIDRFLRELPPIYGAKWLLAWQNTQLIIKEQTE